MSKLLSEFKINQTILKNRIVMAPMCMNSASDDGLFTPWHYVHYLSRAIGGVGMIILEATAVEPRGRITDRDLGLWDQAQIPALKQFVHDVKKHNTCIGVQLAHAGRKSKVKGTSIAPSKLAYPNYPCPQAMTKADILEVINAFKSATSYALACDFDFIEIHAAHGYLINQFLSPITNQRNDEYGRNIQGRTLFLRQILDEVRSIWPKDKLLLMRISADEFCEGGNKPNDYIEILQLLTKYKIDLIDISSGGISNNKIIDYPGYQLPLAKKIKDAGHLVIAGGLITNGEMADEAIRHGDADLIYFGRELLRNPYFPLQYASKMKVDHFWPNQYLRAK